MLCRLPLVYDLSTNWLVSQPTRQTITILVSIQENNAQRGVYSTLTFNSRKPTRSLIFVLQKRLKNELFCIFCSIA
jgi:hypothetical protein